MKRQMAIVAALIVFMGCSHDHDKDKDKDTEEVKAAPLTATDLPAAVQSTVTHESNGGTITHISRHHHHDMAYYKVYVDDHGKRWELVVREDGRLLEKNQEYEHD